MLAMVCYSSAICRGKTKWLLKIEAAFLSYSTCVTTCFFAFLKAERMRKQADLERQEAVDNLSQAVSTNNVLTQAKKKLEGTIGTLQEEAEDLENEAKIADDKAKKALFEVRFKVFFFFISNGWTETKRYLCFG